MTKQVNIVIKSLRMALLGLAVLIYGTPAMASMPAHDMTQMVSQTSEMASVHSECDTADVEPIEIEDCCQTDECASNCMSGVSMFFANGNSHAMDFETKAYTKFIALALAYFEDSTNPPPIS